MSATCSSDRVSVHFCRSVVELHVTRQMLVEGVKRERDGRREHKKGREARHGRISAAFNHAILWLVWVWVSIFQSQEVGSPRWTLVISSHRNGRLVCHWPLCLSLRTGWNRVHLRTVFLSWGTWGQNQLFHSHTYTNQISSSSCSSFLQILFMTKARGFPGIFIWPECVQTAFPIVPLSPQTHRFSSQWQLFWEGDSDVFAWLCLSSTMRVQSVLPSRWRAYHMQTRLQADEYHQCFAPDSRLACAYGGGQRSTPCNRATRW